MKDKIFIVEDDPVIASDLSGILEDLGYTVAGMAHEPFEARKRIDECKPKLILMDVNLGSTIDGIDLATLLQKNGAGIIFITAFTDKATRERVKAINPLGYIIKPFDEKDIEVAIDLALYKLQQDHSEPAAPAAGESIFIKTGTGTSRKVVLSDIHVIEAYDNYCYIHFAQEKIMVSYTLKDLEQKMAAPFLLRVHRSYVVNISRVDSIRNGSLMIGNLEAPVGKSYREEVLKLFPTL